MKFFKPERSDLNSYFASVHETTTTFPLVSHTVCTIAESRLKV